MGYAAGDWSMGFGVAGPAVAVCPTVADAPTGSGFSMNLAVAERENDTGAGT
jgi:hypothetical protein